MEKKLKIKILIRSLIFFGVVLLFTFCGTDQKKEIIGNWKDQNGKIITFMEDGNVNGLARNIKRELVDGSFDIRNDSLFVRFLAAPAPRNIEGILEFRIQKLDIDSLVLNTQIGNIVYSRITK
jgi:hypothetical protein